MIGQEEEGAELQWRVTWFPPDGDTYRVGSEGLIRRLAAKQAEWNPVIETREIVVGEWKPLVP